tara:strand:+ start:138475 stop:139605 length:1131 start_codon:yes stop_codon:yes gene_type:complete
MSQIQQSKNMKYILIITIAITALAGTFYLGTNFTQAPPAPTQPNALPVKAMSIKSQTIQRSISLPARVNAVKESQVRPQVNGIITDILFAQGAKIKKGDQLYQIDETPYLAVYNSALANVKKAQAKNDRFKDLMDINAVSKQEYDDAVASLAQAKADLAVAKVELDYTKVYAPIDGYIGKSSVTTGALVTANQTTALAHITQLQPVYIDISIPSKDLVQLRSQFTAEKPLAVDFTLGNDTVATGYVNFAESVVDKTTDTVNIRATYSNEDEQLLPGMFIRTALKLEPREAILVSHKAAVRQADGTLAVWKIASDNSTAPHFIDAKDSYNNSWIVTIGVAENDVIVTEGFQKLRPKMKVSPEMEIMPNTQSTTVKEK